MKGQLSLELLIIVSIFLVLIGLSLSFLLGLKDMALNKITDYNAKLTLRDIVNSIDNVCVMGAGNSRVVNPTLNEFELTKDGELLSLTSNNQSVTSVVSCNFNLIKTEFNDSTITVYYDNGAKVK